MQEFGKEVLQFMVMSKLWSPTVGVDGGGRTVEKRSLEERDPGNWEAVAFEGLIY